jgi:hypothetical protein
MIMLTPEQEALKVAANSGRDLEFEMLVSHELVSELFTALEAARNAALEDAAAECEREKWYEGARQASQAHNNVWDAAKAIRALKSAAPKLAEVSKGE